MADVEDMRWIVGFCKTLPLEREFAGRLALRSATLNNRR